MSVGGNYIYPEGFEINHSRSAGNLHSRHNVVFGELDGVDVALKPFLDGAKTERDKAANHEARMYETVRGMGFLTLEPFSIISQDDATFLATLYAPNLVTGSSFDMNPSIGESEKSEKIISGISSDMGALIRDGVTHGDAKLRNFSFHRIYGDGPYIVDLEGAQVHDDRQKTGADYFYSLFKSDLRSISHDFGKYGYGAGLVESERTELFGDTVWSHIEKGFIESIPGSITDAALAAYIDGVQRYLAGSRQT